ncbi:MAG TPA: tetrahydrofolate dehydrogenase/cyclohydrolase catalytic domain-containing protein [bacterium]
MSAKVYDGKVILNRLSSRIKRDAERLARQHQIEVGLGIILVTGDQVSMSESGKIARTAEQLGITVKMERVAQRNIARRFFPTLEEYADSPFIQGIFVQLPLPTEIVPLEEVMKRLPPEKDVAGIHFINRGKSTFNPYEVTHHVYPPECSAIRIVFKDIKYELDGGKVALIGSKYTSDQVKMLAGYLFEKGCSVNLLRWENFSSSDKESRQRVLDEDLPTSEGSINPDGEAIISWANQPGWLGGSRIQRGSTVIDMGYKFARGKVSGDCDFQSAMSVAGTITPVPGGARNIVHMMVLQNLIDMIKRHYEDEATRTATSGLKRRFKTDQPSTTRKLRN